MGNDKQIKNSLEKSKAVFLPELIDNPEGKPVLYSLENEYAKSRKNKPFLLYLFIVGFVVLIIVVSMIFISVKQRMGKNVDIDIKEFEDVKLKELIESSRKNEDQIALVRKDLSLLEEDYQNKVDKINQEFMRLKEGLSAKDMSPTEKKTQTSIIESDKDIKLKQAEKDYTAKKREKEKEISAIQNKLKDFGTNVMAKAKQYKDILGGEGKLRSMEMNRLSADYENKIRDLKEAHRKEREELILLYNPIFKEKDLQEIIQKSVPETKSKSLYFLGISDELAMGNAISKEGLSSLSEDMKKSIALEERMKQIPYINSVQRSLLHSDSLAKQIFNSYDSILQKMVSNMQGKNLNVKYFGYAFDYLTRSQQENGFILDPRDTKKIGLYFSKSYKPHNGDLAFVFRTDDEYIATLKIKTLQGILVGEVIDNAAKKQIRPFDKLMLKMEREKK
jgi:hypothetical protein